MWIKLEKDTHSKKGDQNLFSFISSIVGTGVHTRLVIRPHEVQVTLELQTRTKKTIPCGCVF